MKSRLKLDKKNRSTVRNLALVVVFSIGMTFLMAGGDGSLVAILLNITYGVLIGTSISLGATVISSQYFNNNEWKSEPSRVFAKAVVATAIFIIADVLLINIVWFAITQGVGPIPLLKNAWVLNTMGIEFILGMGIYLLLLSKSYAISLKENYEQLRLMEKEAEIYRYETLRNQINPHFLFNTLNTLSDLIYTDTERSDEFIRRFANIYRYVLEVQHFDVIKIERELAFVQDYTFLNNIRFEGQIELDLAIKNKDQFIVPMALQLLIENTIKHNKIGPGFPMSIRVYENKNRLFVENAIQLKENKDDSFGIGINNLKTRYKRVSDRDIEIKTNDKTYAVSLPVLNHEQ